MYNKEVTKVVELTITRKAGKTASITHKEEVTFCRSDTKSVVVKKAALRWLNVYLNRDVPESKKKEYDNYEIAKQSANVNIKGEVLNYKF